MCVQFPGMYRILVLVLALARLLSGHFLHIWPNWPLAKFLVGFPDLVALVDFSTVAVQADCLQLKVMTLVSACHHLSDLMVRLSLIHSRLN